MIDQSWYISCQKAHIVSNVDDNKNFHDKEEEME